ncbi:hypothetical protein JZ751_003325 [Albula glossodonta]|uniref:Uncharacterized protein n=1 Tax=Albula glossodonta TaxID=121402 RepID=A0A8T2N6Q6_9TELE|nr:hypothetical protein JZ751_003325 [Albula glossodonta]
MLFIHWRFKRRTENPPGTVSTPDSVGSPAFLPTGTRTPYKRTQSSISRYFPRAGDTVIHVLTLHGEPGIVTDTNGKAPTSVLQLSWERREEQILTLQEELSGALLAEC